MYRSAKDSSDGKAKALLEQVKTDSESILSEWLDSEKGKSVTDDSIFNKLPRHFENEFNKDMEALNVKKIFFLSKSI